MERWTHLGLAVATVLAACGSSPDRSAEGQASPPPTGEASPPPIVFVLYDPGTGTSKPLGGLPSGTILDLEVDRMVVPPALHVATDAGAAALRLLP